MRQGKVLLLPMFIIAGLCIIGIIVGLIFMTGASQKPESLLTNISVERLSDLDAKQDYDGIYTVYDRKEFGYNGDIRAEVDEDNNILWVSFETVLLEKNNFDIKNADSAVDGYISAFSDFIGLSTELKPVELQFTNDEVYANKPDGSMKALMENYVLFEYSVRDSEGYLWIVQICSPRENLLCASVLKLFDESGFKGYIPQITMERTDKQ